jgi:hypothetical protein
VKKPVQPVAGKFGDDHGVHECGEDPDKRDMQAVVQHDLDSFPGLSAAPETKTMPMDPRTAFRVFPYESRPWLRS